MYRCPAPLELDDTGPFAVQIVECVVQHAELLGAPDELLGRLGRGRAPPRG
jgi:hypothetical protein